MPMVKPALDTAKPVAGQLQVDRQKSILKNRFFMFRMLGFFFVLSLFTAVAFPYTAVLKNGKRIEGLLVYEDDSQIRIKDLDGVEITIRKSILDANTTRQLNVSAEAVNAAEEKSNSSETTAPKSLAEISRENRAKEKGKSRVLRKEDIEKLPEITVLGTEESYSTEEFDASDAAQAEAENAWKAAALEIDHRLQHAKRRYESLKKECDQLRIAASFAVGHMLQAGVVIGPPIIEQAADTCARMEAAEADMISAEEELEMLQEEARRKQIPPGWVDPLRLK